MTVQQSTGVPNQNSPFVAGPNNSITQVWYFFLQLLYQRTGGISGNTFVQTGVVVEYAGATIPDGYLACDGSAVSRTTFSALFQAIGTTWGDGDGTTTFNVPDRRNNFGIGASATYPLGSTGGASTVALAIGNLPAHNHPVIDPHHNHALTDPNHDHAEQYTPTPGGAVTGMASLPGTGSGVSNVRTQSSSTGITLASAATGITIGNTGSGTAFSIIPPYAAMNYMIKT
jgi:microcystin-dependent protein